MTSHAHVAPPPLLIGPTALVRYFALFTLIDNALKNVKNCRNTKK